MFIFSCIVSILYCRGVQGVMQHAVSCQDEITVIHYTFKSLSFMFFMFLKDVLLQLFD